MTPRERNDVAVLITGASSGIGETTALALARAGFFVFAGVRRAEDAELLLRQTSGQLKVLLLDVTDEKSIASALEAVTQEVKRVRLAGIINNAGVAISGPLEFVPIKEFRTQLEVNVTGVLALTQAFLPLLRSGKGRIINVGSSSGRLPTPMLGAYSTSKFALRALTDVLRMELYRWGVYVSLIEPGNIETPMWSKSLDAMNERFQHLPEHGQRWYGPTFAAATKLAKQVRKTPAEAVAKTVLHALTSKRPRPSYLVGENARLEASLAVLPIHLRDRLISLTFPLHKSTDGRES